MEDQVLKLQLAQTKEYLDIDDVALITGFSLSTLHRKIKKQTLKKIQKGKHHKLLFKKADVMDWIENGAR
jgi:predicted DNA-binding transcriptional regulator AlpA